MFRSAVLCFFFLCACAAVFCQQAEVYNWQVPLTVSEGWNYRGPAGIAVGWGHVYVIDAFNERIQVFSTDGQYITQFGGPGKGDGQFTGMSGIAWNAGKLYVTDTGNNRVQVFSADGAFLLQWGHSGHGPGEFTVPHGIILDQTGVVYVVDSGNYRIQAFTAGGQYLRQWGSRGVGNGQFAWPMGIASDRSNHLFVSDSQGNRIEEFSAQGKFIATFGSAGTGTAGMNWPDGIVVDDHGVIYLADSQHNRIKAFSTRGQYLGQIGGDGLHDIRFDTPRNLAVDAQGYLYISEWKGNRLQVLDEKRKVVATWNVDAEGGLNHPHGIAINTSGNIFVLDSTLCAISQFDARGVMQRTWGTYGYQPGEFRFVESSHNGIVIDKDGNLLILDSANCRVQKCAPDGSSPTVVIDAGYGTEPKNFLYARGMTSDSTGNIYIADTGQNCIKKYAPDGKFLQLWGKAGGGDGELNGPLAMTVDKADTIYVADSGNCRVQLFTTDGRFLRKWGAAGVNDGQFSFLCGLAIAPGGDVYACDRNRNDIQQFTADGTFVRKWGSIGNGYGQFNKLAGIAVDAVGRVYAADHVNHHVQVFSPEGKYLSTIGSFSPVMKTLFDGNEFYPIPAGAATEAGGEWAGAGPYRDRNVLADLAQLTICENAVQRAPTSTENLRWYANSVNQCLNVTGTSDTCSKIELAIDGVNDSLNRILPLLPEDSPTRVTLGMTQSLAVEAARRHLADRRATLGTRRIAINGTPLTSAGYAIVIPDQATKPEARTADELQNHLELLTGQDIPVLHDADAGKRKYHLIVGKSALLMPLKVQVDWERLGLEGIYLKTVGPNLIIAGGQRGVLYACYSFLQDYLGCRWYTPDCTVMLKDGQQVVENLDRTYIPALEYHEAFSFAGGEPDWSVRNKSNGHFPRLNDERGGGIRYTGRLGAIGFVHTFAQLVPPADYFTTHPEYFSLENGMRTTSQLCLTNKDVEDIVVAAIERTLRDYPDIRIISVSQNDMDGGFCTCDNCRPIDEQEGSHAGSLLRFVNRVAERIEKTHPEVAIDTLAYLYTRKPPKITKPRANVIVRLCSFECKYDQPFTDAKNAAFQQDLEGWSRISNRLYVWDYVTNFYNFLYPFPNLRVLKPNIQFMIQHGVKGVLEQGNYMSPGGEFEELRTWVLAQLLWNPQADDRQLIHEFLQAYYGPAADDIQQYIELIHDAPKSPDMYMDASYHYSPTFITPQILSQAEKLLAHAEQTAASDMTYLRHVQVAQLPIMYVRILNNINIDEDYLDRFEQIAQQNQVTHVGEVWYDFDNLHNFVVKYKQKLVTKAK